MSSAAKNVRVPVKIVIINTQYIETDASSFKSVVQRLTGKNSTVAVEAAAALPRPPPVAAAYGCCHVASNYWDDQNASGGANGPGLGRLESFNDFDKLFKELPPLDDLLRLYADEFVHAS
ncbi:VQ motif-containing protein 10-like [Lycium ferocissimum]|uniref:VQ motif-containing protein 10-like n=1 Tax=Lycium ferocissimum TaxID=112874 RepID=UPI0028168E19|nr:VQ motif-containing protein 10-like [Lycium ferocissimum]